MTLPILSDAQEFAAAHYNEIRTQLLGFGTDFSAYQTSNDAAVAALDASVTALETTLDSANVHIITDTVSDLGALCNAIIAANPNGGEIHLSPGKTYNLSTGIVLESNWLLDGHGSTILVAAGITSSLTVITNSDQTNGNDEVHVRNLIINCNKANVGVGGEVAGIQYDSTLTLSLHFSLRYVHVKNSTANAMGIHPKGITNLLIESCIVEANGTGLFHGLYLRRNNRVRITNCVAYANLGRGFQLIQCTDLEVVGCTSSLNGADNFYITSCDRFTVTGCTDVSSGADGLYLDVDAAGSNDTRGAISGCSFYGAALNGVNIKNCDGVSLVGNVISTSQQAGISCRNISDALIGGNMIRNVSQAGAGLYPYIYLEATSSKRGVLVTGNVGRSTTIKPSYGVQFTTNYVNPRATNNHFTGLATGLIDPGTSTVQAFGNTDTEDSHETVGTLVGGLTLNGTLGALTTHRLTTAQRDALTPVDGMVLYNTTLNKLQVRAAGAWVDLH